MSTGVVLINKADVLPPLWLERMVSVLVFLFPLTVATVGWGSSIMLLILLPALYFGRGWTSLQPGERYLLLGMLMAFLAMSLSMVNAEEIREGAKALDRYFRFVLLIPIYLMFRRYGFMLGRELAAGAALACIFMGIQAFYQVKVQGLGIAEGYYHKIVFGDLAVWWASVTAVVAVILLKSWWLRLGLVFVISAAFYASILSYTRGSWLFIPVIPLILLWAQWGRLGAMRSWVIAGVVVSLFVAVGLGLQSDRFKGGVKQGIHELELFAQEPNAGTSWGIRLNLWRNSLLLLEETPILGSGVGDFQSDMKRMVADGRSWNQHVVNFGHAHSIYFDTLAKGGVLGFLATVTALLVLPFLVFVRAVGKAIEPWERFYAIGGVLLISAFATFGLSEGLWSRNPFVNTYVICLVVFLSGLVNSQEKAKAELAGG